MNNEITPFLGIMDFVPVLTMFVGLMILYDSLKNIITRSSSMMLVVSSVIILLASGSKATHKTIIGLNGTDIEFMYRFFWSGMAFGCMLLLIALLRIEKNLKGTGGQAEDSKSDVLYATMPLKPVFMLLEAVGLFGSYIVLLRWAIKLKNRKGIILFAVSLVLVPVQLRLGQIFNDTSVFHWVGQSVNFLSTLMFTAGIFIIKNSLHNLPKALQKKNKA